MAIHVLDLRTKQVSTMPDSKALWSPRLSPEGKYILALSSDSTSLQIHTVGGSGWKELVRMAFINNVSWSADCQYIYFDGRRDFANLNWPHLIV
jgi:WD40 repeat protein